MTRVLQQLFFERAFLICFLQIRLPSTSGLLRFTYFIVLSVVDERICGLNYKLNKLCYLVQNFNPSFKTFIFTLEPLKITHFVSFSKRFYFYSNTYVGILRTFLLSNGTWLFHCFPKLYKKYV